MNLFRKKRKQPTTGEPVPLAQANKVREAKLEYCREVCARTIAKLRRGEPLSPYEKTMTEAAIEDLINS
ncbi:hypothetical protein [Microscilla marina]|uniref:Uncharacterized protein n=1 Tax=Microscilla marina ATCC 23134 TaxID=313606 RepID=A1ZDQ1_MICM2|nr:hypothetical protein [Microscilla marina]EAY31209.1 conserved hypothetical protein [Microscilla marina ATCC 23134]